VARPRRSLYDPSLETDDELKAWIRSVLRSYEFDIRGLLLRDGTVLPLPSESALIAKLFEITLLERFRTVANAVRGLEIHGAPGTRTYPDIWLSGDRIGGRKIALEVKAARRNRTGTRTSSRITLGPYDKYFRNPEVKMAGAVLPYGEFTSHLAIIVLYDYEGGEISGVEPLVVEKWRVASRKRSSGTRKYFGAVMEIDRLRREQGEFASADEFYDFWQNVPL
jgi:Restriction endonuclease EcoRV